MEWRDDHSLALKRKLLRLAMRDGAECSLSRKGRYGCRYRKYISNNLSALDHQVVCPGSTHSSDGDSLVNVDERHDVWCLVGLCAFDGGIITRFLAVRSRLTWTVGSSRSRPKPAEHSVMWARACV